MKNKIGIKNKKIKNKPIRWYGKPCGGRFDSEGPHLPGPGSLQLKPCQGIEPLDDPF